MYTDKAFRNVSIICFYIVMSWTTRKPFNESIRSVSYQSEGSNYNWCPHVTLIWDSYFNILVFWYFLKVFKNALQSAMTVIKKVHSILVMSDHNDYYYYYYYVMLFNFNQNSCDYLWTLNKTIYSQALASFSVFSTNRGTVRNTQSKSIPGFKTHSLSSAMFLIRLQVHLPIRRYNIQVFCYHFLLRYYLVFPGKFYLHTQVEGFVQFKAVVTLQCFQFWIIC